MIFLVIGLILAVAAFIAIGQKKEKLVNPLGISVAILILLIGIAGSCIRTVDAGEVGIKYDPFNGGVQEDTLGQGIHLTHPFVTVYDLKTTHNLLQFAGFSVQTADSEYATFMVEVKYDMSVNNAYKVFNAYKGMPNTSMLQMDIQDAIKSNAPNYNIYDILGSSFDELKTNTEATLSTILEEYGLNLISINFIDIDAGDAIESAIVTKGILKQEKEQAAQKILIAEENQKAATIEAETDKKVMILDAEAQAESKLLDAEAQAKSMELIQEQLAKSPEYIEYIKWSAWDGILPEVMAGEGASLILDARDNSPETTID